MYSVIHGYHSYIVSILCACNAIVPYLYHLVSITAMINLESSSRYGCVSSRLPNAQLQYQSVDIKWLLITGIRAGDINMLQQFTIICGTGRVQIKKSTAYSISLSKQSVRRDYHA